MPVECLRTGRRGTEDIHVPRLSQMEEASSLKSMVTESEGKNDRMEFAQHQSSTVQEPAAGSRCSERTQRFSSEVQWSRYRPVIKKLYMDEDRTLHDVMEIMKRDFGFDAT